MSLKNKEKKPINFDNFTSNYENKISKSFGYIDDNVSYYHAAKSIIAKNEIGYNPNKILDFGCGIGSMLKFLKKNFNNSKFYAYDESLKSLEHVKTNYSDVNCLNNLDISEKFDLIFVSNVIHHIKSKDRYSFFQKIYKLLDSNGSLLIYEHNPYNPITQKIVANCEFDVDAELIKKNDLIKLCNENNFLLHKSGYIHFFPSKLKFLFNLEKYLKWLFLGAQYFCIFKKKI
jgi:SAM-dependent methyltransferase